LSNKERDIQDFWQENPVGENLTGKNEDWVEHFKLYDAFRYRTEGHILGELDKIDFQDKTVLEIGIGQAADSIQIAQRGATWSGLDLTEAAVKRANIRFELANQTYGEAKQGSATTIPWPDNSFNIVYSHGVLHHIPQVKDVSKEISRVLEPDGKLILMVYHKGSLNYYLSIGFIRRVGLAFVLLLDSLGLFKAGKESVIGIHIANARNMGVWNYMNMETFIHHNTDGPENPYSKVYNIDDIHQDFEEFEIEQSGVHFVNVRHFPGLRLLPSFAFLFLEKRFGWHLWGFLRNKKSPS